jgi:hypothetical protein
LISIVRSPTSGTSRSKSRRISSGWLHRGRGVADLHDQRLHPLAHLVLLAGDLLAPRHDPLDAAEVDDHRRPLEPGDRAGDDRADPVLVFLVDRPALVGPDELDHHLLDGLRADAAHDRQRHDVTVAGDGNVPGRLVQRDGELGGVLGVVVLAQPRRDRLLDVGVDLVAVDVLVARDAVHDADQFRVGHKTSSLSRYSVVLRQSLEFRVLSSGTHAKAVPARS